MLALRNLLIIYLLLPIWLSAQTEDSGRDNELWTGATLKASFHKKWRGEIEQQARFNEDISEFKNTFTEIGIRYKLHKFVAVKAQYRYTIRNDKNDRQRLSGDLLFNWKKKKFPLRFQYRMRFQDTKEVESQRKFTFIRNRGKIEYNLSKLVDPYFLTEFFYRFNERNEFRAIRYSLGLEWRLSKEIDLATSFTSQREINVNSPGKENIFALRLSYTLDLKKE